MYSQLTVDQRLQSNTLVSFSWSSGRLSKVAILAKELFEPEAMSGVILLNCGILIARVFSKSPITARYLIKQNNELMGKQVKCFARKQKRAIVIA